MRKLLLFSIVKLLWLIESKVKHSRKEELNTKYLNKILFIYIYLLVQVEGHSHYKMGKSSSYTMREVAEALMPSL